MFSALWCSVWYKNKEDGPPGPSPGSAIDVLRILEHVIMKCPLIHCYILYFEIPTIHVDNHRAKSKA